MKITVWAALAVVTLGVVVAGWQGSTPAEWSTFSLDRSHLEAQAKRVLATHTTADAESLAGRTLAWLSGLVTGRYRAVATLSSYSALEELPQPVLVAVVSTTGVPRERTSPAEPFLSSPDAALSEVMQVANAAAERTAALLGLSLRHTFALAPLNDTLAASGRVLGCLYDLDRGVVYVAPSLYAALVEVPLAWAQHSYAELEQQSSVLHATNAARPSSTALDTLLALGAAAVRALHQSVWECLACIIVLAIGLPLAANFVLADLVQLLCKVYQVPAATCIDYVLAAVLLVDLLLPLFAYAIFKVCKLQAGACQSAV